ncbi:hypothetical protein SPURM210S_06851 [Streptomyces purpurascens]
MRADYERALVPAHQQWPKSLMAAATKPEDVRPVTQTGWRTAGSPAVVAPARGAAGCRSAARLLLHAAPRPLDFADAGWTASGGTTRDRPRRGRPARRGPRPGDREVDTDYGRRPAEAGPGARPGRRLLRGRPPARPPRRHHAREHHGRPRLRAGTPSGLRADFGGYEGGGNVPGANFDSGDFGGLVSVEGTSVVEASAGEETSGAGSGLLAGSGPPRRRLELSGVAPLGPRVARAAAHCSRPTTPRSATSPALTHTGDQQTRRRSPRRPAGSAPRPRRKRGRGETPGQRGRARGRVQHLDDQRGADAEGQRPLGEDEPEGLGPGARPRGPAGTSPRRPRGPRRRRTGTGRARPTRGGHPHERPGPETADTRAPTRCPAPSPR